MTSSVPNSANCPGCRLPRATPGRCEAVQCYSCNTRLCRSQLNCPRCGAIVSTEVVTCPVHPTLPVDMFCIECRSPCCTVCYFNVHSHHKIVSVEQAAMIIIDQLAAKFAKLEKALTKVTSFHVELGTQDESLTQLKRQVVEETKRKIRLIEAAGKALENELDGMKSNGQRYRNEADSQITDLKKFLERRKDWEKAHPATILREGGLWLTKAVRKSHRAWVTSGGVGGVAFRALKLEDWVPIDEGVNIVGDILCQEKGSNIGEHRTRVELQDLVSVSGHASVLLIFIVWC